MCVPNFLLPPGLQKKLTMVFNVLYIVSFLKMPVPPAMLVGLEPTLTADMSTINPYIIIEVQQLS